MTTSTRPTTDDDPLAGHVGIAGALLRGTRRGAGASVVRGLCGRSRGFHPSLYEFELRLHQLGADAATRATELNRYRALLNEVVDVDEAVRSEAIRLRTSATAHVAAMDVLIAATASLKNATLVHRDPHFAAIPASLLKQEVLPAK